MWGRRAAISWDDIARIQNRLDEVLSEVVELSARVNAMQIEWEDTRDRVVRSYKRLDQSMRREQAKANPPAPPSPPDAGDEPTDPFTRKLLEIRRQGGAIPHGDDASAG